MGSKKQRNPPPPKGKRPPPPPAPPPLVVGPDSPLLALWERTGNHRDFYNAIADAFRELGTTKS